jgi:hypothetical protein
MELHVCKTTSLREVKRQFSTYFPFLKLEFFVYRHHTEETALHKKIYTGLYIDNTSEFFKEGSICFSFSTSIAEFEQKFQIELGLAAKVFRKSADTWIDTTQTAHLTLGRQNNMGASLFMPKINLHTLFL